MTLDMHQGYGRSSNRHDVVNCFQHQILRTYVEQKDFSIWMVSLAGFFVFVDFNTRGAFLSLVRARCNAAQPKIIGKADKNHIINYICSINHEVYYPLKTLSRPIGITQ